MTIDPFVVFVIALIVIIGAGGLYIDRHGRMPKADAQRPRPQH